MIWFVLAFLHINHCRSFNVKSSLSIYIEYMNSKIIIIITY